MKILAEASRPGLYGRRVVDDKIEAADQHKKAGKKERMK